MAKRRPQGDGMVRKRSDGRWEARIVIGHKNDGTPMHKSVFGKTQKETLDKLHRAIETYRDVDLCEDSRMTLGEWLDKWLDEYMIFTLRESTMQSYRMIVNHYIKPHLGKKPLTSLTTADIQKLYNKLKKEGRVREDPIKGKTLADSMVRGIHMMLHEALDAAVKERLIVRNPTNGTTVPKPNYPDKQVLDDGQLEKFLGMIEAYPDWRDFFYTECMTGLRHGDNRKWFALIMKVSMRKFGFDSDRTVDIVNLKLPVEMFGSFSKEDGVYPAYHMNKLHWISVLFSDAADGTVEFLTNVSYEATKTKRRNRKSKNDSKNGK